MAKNAKDRPDNKKLKLYIILQYLLKYTDEENPVSCKDLIAFLEERGFLPERRSVYRDIHEINTGHVMMENDCTLEEAEELLAEDEEAKLVRYRHKHGFYIQQNHYDTHDIQLLAACVYSAKFIDEKRAIRLVNVVCNFVSEHQAKKIRHEVVLTDRIKTNNRETLTTIEMLNDAMSEMLNGQPHTPEKVSFQYLKYTMDDIRHQTTRRHGDTYKVSPYRLLINDSYYYLLAYDDKAQKMLTYRVDRMKGVELTGEPREGEKAFYDLDMQTYTQRVFSMYGGKRQTVSLRCINPLLDTMIDRFGTEDATYRQFDKSHFILTTEVEISDQFFGWLLGFGKRVKLITPIEVAEQFTAYLDKIRQMYES